MISLEVWSSVQRCLLDDPGYVGVRAGADGALVLYSLPGHTPGEAASAASALLREAGCSCATMSTPRHSPRSRGSASG